MITLADYWMGRDELYPDELTDEIRANAVDTLAKVNAGLELAAADGVFPGTDPRTGTAVSSGWRPRAINDRTRNSAGHSKHLTAQACDIRDGHWRDVDRALARWSLANEGRLKAVGILSFERPAWTPTWVHWGTVAVPSGRWCYIPSQFPCLVAALPGEVVA